MSKCFRLAIFAVFIDSHRSTNIKCMILPYMFVYSSQQSAKIVSTKSSKKQFAKIVHQENIDIAIQ